VRVLVYLFILLFNTLQFTEVRNVSQTVISIGGGGGYQSIFKNKIKLVGWLTGYFLFLEVHYVRYIVESNGKLQLIGIINSVRKISVKKQICIEFL
jgi:hypothetical protein